MAEQGEGKEVVAPLSIHICCDNTPSAPGFKIEWGFCAAVRLPNGSLWLFDTGQSGLFADNGRRLDIDLSTAKGLILSHGHYDHSGGIPVLFRTGFSGPIYAHAGCTQQRFRIKEGTPPKSIGIPLESLNRARDLITPFPPDGRLDQGLLALSPIPRRHGLFQATMGFFLDPKGTTPDTVEDDLALLLDSPKGPALLLGCCHSGLANTMYAAGDTAGIKKIHAVVGGLHLTGAGTIAVEESAAAIREFGVQEVYAGHCTGAEEMVELSVLLPGRVKPLGAGRVLEF